MKTKNALLMTLMALLMATTLLQSKILVFGSVKFTAATFTVVLFYFIVGVFTEVWGKDEARSAVISGVAIRFVFYGMLMPLLLSLPGIEKSPVSEVMHTAFRMMIAGDVATLVGTLIVLVPLLSGLKNIQILPRFSLAQVVSLAIASTTFVILAFAGTGVGLFDLVIGQAVSRIVLAALLSLLSPLAVKAVSRG